MFNQTIHTRMAELQEELRASSCLLYLQDPGWPGEYRLIGLSGVRHTEPMFGFVYSDSARNQLQGDDDLYRTYDPPELGETPPALDGIPKHVRHLFGSFRVRERVISFARVTENRELGDRRLILFVNYDERTEFGSQLKSSIKAALRELAELTLKLECELAAADLEWRSEATRIVSPAQTLASLDTHSLDEPDTFFNHVIEDALQALNIPKDKGLGVLHLYDEEDQRLELRGFYGSIEFLERAKSHSVRVGDGVVSWVALTKRSLVIQDLSHSEFNQFHVSINENTKSELVVPLEIGGELIGTLCLECTEPGSFLPHHAYSLWYAANKAALAYQLYQLASMNRKLLDLCGQATRAEGGAQVSLDDLAKLAKDYLKASSCEISRYNTDTRKYDAGGASFGNFIPQVRANGWTEFVRKSKCPVWITEIEQSPKYSVHVWRESEWQAGEAESEFPEINPTAIESGVRSALGIPIAIRNDCVGVAWVRYRRSRSECPRAGLMSLALGFAAEAGLVLDSILRRDVDIKEREKIDLMAEEVVKAIAERWELNNSSVVEAYVISEPLHSKLGGDFYAGKNIDDRTVGILLVDGQGHGVGGSLHMLPLMTAFESVFQSYSTAHVISHLAKTAETLGVRGSAIYCILSFIDGTRWLSVTSAGHENLIWLKRGERSTWSFEYVPDAQVLMLGPRRDEPLMDHWFKVSPGDVIVGYTDGIADQLHSFNTTNLAAFVTNFLGEETTHEPAAIADAIVKESRQKHGGSFTDDATVLVIRVK